MFPTNGDVKQESVCPPHRRAPPHFSVDGLMHFLSSWVQVDYGLVVKSQRPFFPNANSISPIQFVGPGENSFLGGPVSSGPDPPKEERDF